MVPQMKGHKLQDQGKPQTPSRLRSSCDPFQSFLVLNLQQYQPRPLKHSA